jgi:outer membrane lipoprotein carrier protein
VTQEDNRFVVTPKNNNGQIRRLTLRFATNEQNNGALTDEGSVQLSEFSFQDATGQVSQISLSNFNSKTKPDEALFTFVLPEGERLEDKR